MHIKNFDYQISKDHVWLFRNLNLNFSEQQINVLVGPNGVGKSILLDLIADVDHHRPRTAFFDFPPKEEIVYQLQGVPFFSEITVKRMLQLVLKIDGAKQYQQQVPLAIQDIYKRRMGVLSGGQRRLVLIYGLSLLERELYLFDEPESGLDPEVAKQAMNLIEGLKDRGKKIILTTHQFTNLNEKYQLFFIANQQCVYTGSLTELISTAKTTDVAKVYQYFRTKGK